MVGRVHQPRFEQGFYNPIIIANQPVSGMLAVRVMHCGHPAADLNDRGSSGVPTIDSVAVRGCRLVIVVQVDLQLRLRRHRDRQCGLRGQGLLQLRSLCSQQAGIVIRMRSPERQLVTRRAPGPIVRRVRGRGLAPAVSRAGAA